MKVVTVLEKTMRRPSFYGLCGMKVEREVVVVRSYYRSVIHSSYVIDGNKSIEKTGVTCVSDPFQEYSASSLIEKVVNGLVGLGFKVKYQL